MNKAICKARTFFTVVSTAVLLITSCNLQSTTSDIPETSPTSQMGEWSNIPLSTPLPTRPSYKPGELVEYIAQDGDTLPALAARFNTTVDEILPPIHSSHEMQRPCRPACR
jgi:LysM repeat protein